MDRDACDAELVFVLLSGNQGLSSALCSNEADCLPFLLLSARSVLDSAGQSGTSPAFQAGPLTASARGGIYAIISRVASKLVGLALPNFVLMSALARAQEPAGCSPRAGLQLPLRGRLWTRALRAPARNHAQAQRRGARWCEDGLGPEGDAALPTLSSCATKPASTLCFSLAAAGAAWSILAGPASAEGFLPTEQYVGLLKSIEAMGAWGVFAFYGLTALGEMVPLFPTQPLAIGAGLLFPIPVAVPVILAANLTAACGAFAVSRGPGRTFAQRIIRMEAGHDSAGDGEGGKGLAALVQSSTQGTNVVAQTLGIMLLRFSPATPYSASNYLLGLSPIPFTPFFVGTLLGMTPWAVALTSLGRASRSLLQGGDPAEAMAELGEHAAELSQAALKVSGVLAAAGAAFFLGREVTKRLNEGASDSPTAASVPDDAAVRDQATGAPEAQAEGGAGDGAALGAALPSHSEMRHEERPREVSSSVK